jgi:(R,R)-butanediol dehydrogenase/meso-butanediol dehydrogenase/diacetyl reductase
MKAAIFHEIGRPLTVETVEDPKPGPRDVIIKTHRCGVCGTDLHITSDHAWAYPKGSLLGHEYAGEVVEVGSEVTRVRKGDFITAVPATGCRDPDCEVCARGNFVLCPLNQPLMTGFAEYIRAPDHVAVRLPSIYTAADGALVEPFAVGLYGVRVSQIRPGDRVLVLGGGSVALTTIYWAKRLGARRVAAVSRSKKRAAMALHVGADAFIQSGEHEVAEVIEALGGPPDIVYECVGVPGFLAKAVEHVGRYGKVISMGFCMAPDTVVPAAAGFKGAQFLFPVGYSVRDFEYAADALHDGGFDPTSLITSVVSLEEFPEAFEALRGPNNETKMQVEF